MIKHQILRLSTGERVGVTEMPWTESVSLGVWAGVGGRHDPEPRSGLAHFVEHMVFKGTKRRSARRLNSDVESVGGNMDAYTSEDHTCFYVRGPVEHFSRFADVLFDLYQHSIFTGEDVRKEREVIAEEIAMYREQPQQHVEDLLCRTVWPKHPLGRPIAGTEESLKAITTPALRQHAASYFGRKNTVISVAGRVEAAEVRELLEKVIARGLPEGRRPATRLFKPGTGRPRIAAETRDIDQVQLTMAFHAPGRGTEHTHALRLLSVLLGENTSSRLWAELRERRGLCYDTSSDVTSLQDTGLLHIFAGIDPENVMETLKVIFRELRRFTDKPVSRTALKAACEFSIGSGRLASESPASQMTTMGECLLFYNRYITSAEYYAKLRAVTPEEIQAVARQVFRPSRLNIALVGPETDLARIRRMADGFG